MKDRSGRTSTIRSSLGETNRKEDRKEIILNKISNLEGNLFGIGFVHGMKTSIFLSNKFCPEYKTVTQFHVRRYQFHVPKNEMNIMPNMKYLKCLL